MFFIDFEIEKKQFFIKGLNLLLGFLNKKYPPTIPYTYKNYLRCLLFEGGTFSRGKGLIMIR